MRAKVSFEGMLCLFASRMIVTRECDKDKKKTYFDLEYFSLMSVFMTEEGISVSATWMPEIKQESATEIWLFFSVNDKHISKGVYNNIVVAIVI